MYPLQHAQEMSPVIAEEVARDELVLEPQPIPCQLLGWHQRCLPSLYENVERNSNYKNCKSLETQKKKKKKRARFFFPF